MAELNSQQFAAASSSATQARLERAYALLTEDSEPDGFSNERLLQRWLVEEQSRAPHNASGEVYASSIQGRGACKSFMGCFPEIHRVWFTIDTKLLVWNYSLDATEFVEVPGRCFLLCTRLPSDKLTINSPLTEFLDYNQVILNVGLVKPKKGVFIDRVEYIIAIASFFEILLLSATFSKNKDYNSTMTIHRTEMSIPTEHVIFSQIIGSKNGRLFAGGDNGKIYDIIYQAENGWLSDRIRKVDHSSSYLSMLVPSFIGGRSRDGIKLLALDEQRNLLYALGGNSCIQVIYLGSNGDKYIHCREIKKAEINTALKYGDQVIRGLFVQSYKKCKVAQLVAVTEIGDRIFFSLYNTEEESLKASKGLLAPTTFKVVYVHKENRQIFSVLTKFKNVLFDSGLALGVCSKNDKVDRIWCMTPSIGEIAQSPYKSWLELYDSFDIECDVWKVFRVNNDFNTGQEPGIFGDFYGQIFEEKWTFCALTNIGLQFFDVLRPLDQLYELVSVCGDQLKENYTMFMKTYGRKEMLAMLLEISCSSISKWSAGSADSVGRQVQGAAVNIFLKHEPYIPPQAQNPSCPSTSASDPAHTPRLNGLSLYTSRLFNPFWSFKILDQINQLFGPDRIDEMLKYKRKLERMCILLEKRIIPNLKCVNNMEREYFMDIYRFLSEACEILSLLLIFKDSNHTVFDSGLPPIQRQHIQSLSFGDLVWTREGSSLIQSILTAYIRKVLSLGQHLAPIERLFRNSCPSIYTESSRLFSRGWSKIIKASELPESSQQRNKLLYESVQYFKDEVVDMQASQFIQIIDEYKGLLFYKGIVDMTISWARRNHSNLSLAATELSTKNNTDVIDCLGVIQMALMSIKAECEDLDAPELRRKELESEKISALGCIFSVRNKTFLFNIYSRLISDFTEDFLKAMPPYFEDFLLTLDDNKEKYMILARYYSAIQKHSEAALSYSNLAEMPEFDLDERINHLTHSLFSWRLSPKRSMVDQHLMEDAEIRLKIAYIQQKILRILKTRPDLNANVCSSLQTRFFSLSQLYNDFVLPFCLTELEIEIRKLSNPESLVF